MKILWLAHRDPRNPRAGGAERTIFEVCSRLVERGHEITLLTGGWHGCNRFENINGIKVLRYGTNVGPHIAVPAHIMKDKYDVVVDDLGHAIPWITPRFLALRNIVFFRHLHARSLPGQVNPFLSTAITAVERLYPLIYPDMPFVTESTTSRDDLLRLGIHSDNIIVIPPGVDFSRFHTSEKTDHPSIVYFGGMRTYKRPWESVFLLNSIAEIINDVKLFVIGTGKELENLKRSVTELGIDDSVEFLGRLADKDLPKVVASSWLNVHSSVTEGWGYSILEASAAGTPTVAYDVPGVRDAIEQGKNGIKVADGNREALAKAAMEILQSPEGWWISSQDVARKYSWDRTADEWENLLVKVNTG
jgi:glycosyltransferase involved in cell wall biosynthesis